MSELKDWKIEQKKKAYEMYSQGLLDIDSYRMELSLIDEITE